MYKCECCKVLFEQPNEVLEEGDFYPRPFGVGSYREPDRWVAECPECGAREFGHASFDGANCPQCDEEIDEAKIQYTKIADGDYWEYECPHCEFLLQVKNGKWLEE